MTTYASDVAFTPAVKAIQATKGSRESYARVEQTHGWQTTVTPELKMFLATLDMFYLGTATASGQPYIQYRGGSPGFLKVLDDRMLGFGDFGGNRQFLTMGNLAENSKAFLFLMDYENRRRIKIWGTAKVIEDDPALLNQLRDPTYPTQVERAIVFSITAWDVNCPQHIQRRIPASKVKPTIEQMQARINALEAELHTYRTKSSGAKA